MHFLAAVPPTPTHDINPDFLFTVVIKFRLLMHLKNSLCLFSRMENLTYLRVPWHIPSLPLFRRLLLSHRTHFPNFRDSFPPSELSRATHFPTKSSVNRALIDFLSKPEILQEFRKEAGEREHFELLWSMKINGLGRKLELNFNG